MSSNCFRKNRFRLSWYGNREKIMRKLSVILLIGILSIPLLCNAQSNGVKKFEFEIGFGASFASSKVDDSHGNSTGANLFMEGRYNLTNIPIDIGLQISRSAFERSWAYRDPINFITTTYLVVCDYNFFRGEKVAPFAGAGFGIAHNVGFGYTSTLCFMPRIGVELFNNHLRFSLDYKITQKDNRHMGFTIGGVFGGGRK